MTTIVLADDHEIIRKGLRALLSSEIDLEVIGEASDGLQAVEIAERLHPDILILDLMMPGMSGLKVAARLVKSCPCTGIIILSMHGHEAYLREAILSGARAYVLKDHTAEEIIPAIRQVSAGRCYLDSSFSTVNAPILQKNPRNDNLSR